RQLSTLVGAGFPLVAAMDSVILQVRSPAFKKILAKIKDAVVEGGSLAGALSQFPGVFSPVYINMVRAGETSGALEIVLERLADAMESQQALKNRVRTAMTYPAIMGVVAALVLMLLLVYIVPGLTGIFDDMEHTLPLPTRALIAFSGAAASYWWVLFVALVVLATGYRQMRKTVKGRYFIDKTILAAPIFGILVKKLAVSRFSRTLGSLLENGVSMLSALDIVKNITGNSLIADAAEAAAKDVGKGQALGAALQRREIFPDLSVQMINVGEQSGKLSLMLTKVADVFESEAEMRIMAITAMLEPLMILIMGAIVAFIVLSICLPIFEMSRLV
ncbi:MAG: type II secretion system protein GspF, partial [Desulfobacterales bacterium]|nr:type II secretion system protein GspF [Desulfobacterales bacterium]